MSISPAQTLVFDNGAGDLKAGHAADKAPVYLPNCTAKSRTERKFFVGDGIWCARGGTRAGDSSHPCLALTVRTSLCVQAMQRPAFLVYPKSVRSSVCSLALRSHLQRQCSRKCSLLLRSRPCWRRLWCRRQGYLVNWDVEMDVWSRAMCSEVLNVSGSHVHSAHICTVHTSGDILPFCARSEHDAVCASAFANAPRV